MNTLSIEEEIIEMIAQIVGKPTRQPKRRVTKCFLSPAARRIRLYRQRHPEHYREMNRKHVRAFRERQKQQQKELERV